MDFAGRLAQANGRLKAAKIGVKILQAGHRLCLRATFPPRPGSQKDQPYQQRLYLGYHANPTGLQLAEQEARVVGTLLEKKEFSWEPYLTTASDTPQICQDWITQFEADYFSKRDRTPKTETTWKGDYLKVLRKLQPDQPLSRELMQALILETRPDTKSRKRTCMVLGAFAKFAGIEFDPSPLSGNYSPRRASPRDLPEDRVILDWFYKIKNPAWRWVYGMMATYGLRNHEVFRLDLEELQRGNPVVSVLEDTKTGSRRVWACYPEWFTDFQLSQVKLPNVNVNRPNDKVGHSVTEYLGGLLPFAPYNLRHCWAIRTLEFGLPVELAAQQMGHSVAVHTETYHAWITDRHHQRAYEVLMMRSDRPRPPGVA